MPSSDSSAAAPGNRLLDGLPRGDRDRLLARFDDIEMASGSRLAAPREPPQHVYFPTTGFISLVASVDADASIEVGLVGHEGATPAQAIIDVDGGFANTTTIVQGSGQALRMEYTAFRAEIAACPALRATLQSYLRVVLEHSLQNVPCNRFHGTDQRLARWLLMAHDRVAGDTFSLTQQFLAYMLGVRRAGVTGIASGFQRRELIHYRRGVMTILDREGLEAAACSCYATNLATYARVMSEPAAA